MSLPSQSVASGPLPSATFAGWDTQTEQQPLWTGIAGAVGGAGAIQFSNGAGGFDGSANATLTSNGDMTSVGNCIFSTGPAVNGVSIGTNVLPPGGGGLRVAGDTVLGVLTAGASSLGVITSPGISPGSFGSSLGAAITPGTQYTIAFGAWRFAWGMSPAANGSGDTGAIVFTTPFAGAPVVFCSPVTSGANGYFNPSNVTASQIGNLHGTTTGGTGFSVPAYWFAIG